MQHRTNIRYYWSDPDNGEASGFVYVVREDGTSVWVSDQMAGQAQTDGVALIEKQVNPDELYTRRQAEVPRYIIMRFSDGEVEFYHTLTHWGSLNAASCYSLFDYESFLRGDRQMPEGSTFAMLPSQVLDRMQP